MKAARNQTWTRLVLLCGVGLVSFGCGRDGAEEPELHIGIIATLSGPGRQWGETTLYCARVVADYHNSRGGFRVGGRDYHIRLLVEDDEFRPKGAVRAARRFARNDQVAHVIGPLGDDAALAAAPLLDGAGIVYVHYGFSPELSRERSFGILGMPPPARTLPAIYDYLAGERGVRTVCVLARGSPQAIAQKVIAEELARERGLRVLRFSRFDISEEVLSLETAPDIATESEATLGRMVAAGPDAVVLNGFTPAEMPEALRRLRGVGYAGPVVAQNAQEPDELAALGDAAGEVVFVGGRMPDAERTPYYLELRERYRELAAEWSAEFDTKLYALETLLQGIRASGRTDRGGAEAMLAYLGGSGYRDPFLREGRTVRLIGGAEGRPRREIALPVLISVFADGVAKVVHRGGGNP